MIVRSLDENHDWTFGKGRNNYLKDRAAIVQNINTRLLSFLGDCFFALNEGLDWFNLLGGKSSAAIRVAVATKILDTEGVTGLVEISFSIDENRSISISYEAETIYGSTQQQSITQGFLDA
jgi:hypothetical protein